MDKASRKQLRQQYDDQQKVGGIYAIKNTVNGKQLVDSTADLRGSRNRFEFSTQTGSGVHPKLQADWDEQDGQGFAFEVLEELEMVDGQSAQDYEKDLGLLLEMWLERLAGEELY